MKLKLWILIILFNLSVGYCFGKEIKIALEAFPPLIIDKTTGYTIDMLKEIEKISDLKFKIAISNYSRVKLLLETKKIDIMGHMAVDYEKYDYALPLKWTVPAKNDIYAMKSDNVNPKVFITLKRIGIPRGNIEATGAMIGAPLKSLREVNSIDSLVEMLQLKRVDAISFERASVMTIIQKHKIPNVYYQLHPPEAIATGLGVQNSPEGKKLREELDKFIKQLDMGKIFGDYLKYVNLPDQGIVPNDQ